VIGSRHSSGLVALIDATGLAAVIAAAGEESQFDGLTPLGSLAHARVSGAGAWGSRRALRSEPRERGVLGEVLERRERRAEVTTEVEVRDEAGAVVCRGSFVEKLGRSLA
jgi:hypothetical protein